ncbi:carbon-nitrogen hydrolase family protein [Gemmata sp. G18]|uniref:Carbon-nitrogen hydrolase family protein n=1 Tax=Gemmata palustris TaxID=2822762 RepID=A0ABS5C1G7_9BACT|nr:carbon-nitrogen hydrolase family protein [Gemmata palustris]MBP3959836.1 carbon-nitrogen hydrolase family protein [Gemmata palustris]
MKSRPSIGRKKSVLRAVAEWARAYKVATILGTEWHTSAGRHIAAVVIGASGDVQGVQTKNQLDPTEDPLYAPGHTRQLFEVNGLKFGVAICHEGFRYPETVRWAAVRGAKIVFHPHCTGSDKAGPQLTQWGAADAPYYEKAMMMRSRENTIYFASVNYAFRYQESATSLIAPSGECQRTSLTERKVSWCRTSTWEPRPGCSRHGTRRSGTENPPLNESINQHTVRLY